jgi:hypothetical protein
MLNVQDLDPKEADAYRGASMEQILQAMTILEYELSKLQLIRRAMMSTGSGIFDPVDHGINRYIPHGVDN